MSCHSDDDFEEEEQTPPAGSSTGSIRIKQLQRDSCLNRILEDVNKISQLSGMSLHQLEVKLSLLERLLKSFENAQNHLEYLDESQFNQSHRLTFEEAYFKIKSQILERI